MSNPSSPASSSSSSAAAAAQKEHRRLQEEQTQTLHHHHHHQAEVAAAAAGIIPFPPSSSEDQAHDDRDKDDAELSPPRCEWEFRLSATVPTTALPGASDAIGSVDFDPTGRLLATGGIARKIRLYDVASLLLPPPPGSAAAAGPPAACICAPAKLSSVRWPSPSVVGCGDYDGVVTEYDVERGVACWERDEHAGRRVWSLDYAATTTMAASGSDDRTAHVWDPRSPSGGWATARAGGAVLCVEFDPSGSPLLAVGSADRRAAVYDVRALGRGAVARLDGHARAVTYVRWAGTNGPGMAARRVVTSAADGTHRLWEWSTAAAAEEEVLDAREVFDAREVRSYSGHASARSFVGMGVWRGAGLVASGSESNHVFVYDLRWAKPIWVHPFAFGGGAHGGPVTATCPGPGAAAQVDADGGGFVSAVAWRQASHNDDDGLDGGALVAGGSDGVLKVFTCRRRGDDDDDDHGLRSSSEL